MRFALCAFGCLGLTGLAGCDQRVHEEPGRIGQFVVREQRNNLSDTIQMHHIHLLINHALQMAAQGADMQLQGNSHGPQMLDQAENLMRRAMSGSEMAKMHQLGKAKMPLMKRTHDLADVASVLIVQMRGLSRKTENRDAMRMLNHAVEIAATGSSLIMLGQHGMAGDIDLVLVNHGQKMLGESTGLLHEVVNVGGYSKIVTRTVQRLIGIPENISEEPLY